jgi:D-Tyr-tRNAtyr deacylase
LGAAENLSAQHRQKAGCVLGRHVGPVFRAFLPCLHNRHFGGGFMKEATKKRGRKPIYDTDAERKEAKRLYAKDYYQNHKKPKKAGKSKPSKKRNKSPEPEKDKTLYARLENRLEKLENEVEKLKWELFGRKI